MELHSGRARNAFRSAELSPLDRLSTDCDKKYACKEPGCTKSFRRSEHLSRHRLNHRPSTVFSCSQCPKKFVRLDLFQRHKTRHERGMIFRNVGGVLEIDAASPLIIVDEISSPSTHHSSDPIHSGIDGAHDMTWADMSSNSTLNSADIAEPQIPRDIDRSSWQGFAYGSPGGGPDTLFFDDSARFQDLPDNLEWFFENQQQAGETSTGDSGLMPLQGSHISLSLEDDATTLVSQPLSLDAWSTVQSRLLSSLSSLSLDILQSQFFHPRNLARCYELYFENYHSHFPILHQPTFVVAKVEPLLVAAIITLGSTLSSDAIIYNYGQKVHEALRWIIFQTGKFEPPAPLWCLQALLLVQAQAKMFSSRKHHEMAHVFHGAILTMMKKGRAYSPVPNPDDDTYSTLECSWREWIAQESSRRTAFFAFIMDAQHAVVFGHTPVLSVNDIRLPLPCSESLWNCPTPDLFMRELEGTYEQVQFLPTLKALLARTLVPSICSNFSRLILLHGFLSLMTHLGARECTTLGIESGKLATKDASMPAIQVVNWKEIISAAMSTWSFSLLSQETSLCLEAARPIYRMANIALHTKIVDFHILAEDSQMADKILSKKEFDRARARLKAWSVTADASRAVQHSLLLVKETILNGHRYQACNDNIAARPWCLYNGILVLWGYGEMLEVEDNDHSSKHVSLEEYLGQMLVALENNEGTRGIARNTRGLLSSMRDIFEGCRWELLQEAHSTLDRLVRL